MRILLISPSTLNSGEWVAPYFDMRKSMSPISLLFLREIVKRNHEVNIQFYDHTVNDIKQILGEAKKSDVVGFSVAHFFQYPAVRNIIGELRKEEVDSKIVLGGAFPTYHAKYLCEDNVDIVVNGEGERAFPHLLEILENGENLNQVQGITYREDHSIIDTGLAPFTNLDEIPLPCYDLLPLTRAGYKFITCETSRGCRSNCSFCAIYPHRNWRAYTPEKSLAAMEHAYEYVKYSRAPYILVTDSNFAGNTKRIKQMAALVESEIPSYCPTRLEKVNENAIKDLQKIGIKAVCVGIESASEHTLASMSKHVNITSIEKKLQLLIDHGIIPRTTFIFGCPGEDKDSLISTIKQIRHMVELFGENIHILVFPFRQDVSSMREEFNRYKSFETVADALIPMHNQQFRLWALALEYLVNVYHDTLQPEEQTAMFDELMKSSSEAVIELAKTYDGELPSWLMGHQRYFQLMRS